MGEKEGKVTCKTVFHFTHTFSSQNRNTPCPPPQKALATVNNENHEQLPENNIFPYKQGVKDFESLITAILAKIHLINDTQLCFPHDINNPARTFITTL